MKQFTSRYVRNAMMKSLAVRFEARRQDSVKSKYPIIGFTPSNGQSCEWLKIDRKEV